MGLYAAFSLLLSTTAFAQNDWWSTTGEPAFNQPGLYVFIGGSVSIDMEAESKAESRSVAGSDVDEVVGFKGKIGYRPLEWWAAEVEIEYLTGIDIDSSNSNDAELEYLTATLNGKLYIPFDSVEPFAVLGVGVLRADLDYKSGLNSDTDNAGVAIRMGSGIDFYLSDHLAMVVDAAYVLTTGNVDDLDYVSIGWGLQYKF